MPPVYGPRVGSVIRTNNYTPPTAIKLDGLICLMAALAVGPMSGPEKGVGVLERPGD